MFFTSNLVVGARYLVLPLEDLLCHVEACQRVDGLLLHTALKLLNMVYCTVQYVLYSMYCTVCTVQYCTALHSTALYCTVLYCTVIYRIVLSSAVLYYSVLPNTVLLLYHNTFLQDTKSAPAVHCN